jgi:hypothetical protein
MSGSTSTPPYAMSPIGPNGLPLLEFIQPLPQATVQLSFPTLAETIAENITASGVLNTNTSGGGSSPQPTTTTTTGALASLDIAPQGFFGMPTDFG